MAKVIEKVQRLDADRIRVTFTDASEVIAPTLIHLPPFGIVRVKGPCIYYGGQLVADMTDYMIGGEPC